MNSRQTLLEVVGESDGTYLNPIMAMALVLPTGTKLMIDRGWRSKGSASSTASRIHTGDIKGNFYGRGDLFDAEVVIHPRQKGTWVVQLWRK